MTDDDMAGIIAGSLGRRGLLFSQAETCAAEVGDDLSFGPAPGARTRYSFHVWLRDGDRGRLPPALAARLGEWLDLGAEDLILTLRHDGVEVCVSGLPPAAGWEGFLPSRPCPRHVLTVSREEIAGCFGAAGGSGQP
ncbi:MAG: hypothetical protein LBG06_07480 [Deltaproteobacteria bacterium]|jgi:hypothetical protein|nr:hypothetical protein [Deltaproteobacteria bacterium]